jgi:hypothetical protein
VADSLDQKIYAVCEEWGNRVGDDLKISLEKALRDSGTKAPQIDLAFNPFITVLNGNVNLVIKATGEYWDYINQGVNGTKVKHGSPYSYKKKAVDFEPIEKWIKKNGIDAKGILLDIELKRKGLSIQKGGLRKVRKELSGKKGYGEAAKRLSRIFAVAKARDGEEAKPYVSRVLTQNRLDLLTNRIGVVVGREITLTFKGVEQIKLTV